MSSIFYEHVQGDERESLINEMEMNIRADELCFMLEMTSFQEEMNERQIELKVLKESGTYDDYVYLLEEAQAQNAQNNKNIFTKIFEWFANLFQNIANAFSGTKAQLSQMDPNAQISLPSDYAESRSDADLIKIADELNGCSSISQIATKAIPVILGLGLVGGGVYAYNKKKDAKDNSPIVQMSVDAVTKLLNSLEGAQNKLTGAVNKVKEFFKKDENAQNQNTDPNAQNSKPAENQKTDQKAADGQNNNNTNAQNNNNANTQNNNNANAQNNKNANAQATDQNVVNSSASVKPLSRDEVFALESMLDDLFEEADAPAPAPAPANNAPAPAADNNAAPANNADQGNNNGGEGGIFKSILNKVKQTDGKPILDFLMKIETAVGDKVSAISKYVEAAYKTAPKYLKNTLGNISNKVETIKAGVGTAQNLTGAAQVLTGAGNNNQQQAQPVNASADTEPLSQDEIITYESVFGEKYEAPDIDKDISKEFEAIFEGL